MLHFNQVLQRPWQKYNIDLIFKPACLTNFNKQWNIDYPTIEWNDNTIVVMHCQDFITVDDLYQIENHFAQYASRVIVVYWNLFIDKEYNGPLNLIYFPTHSYELIVELEKIKEQWINKFNTPRHYRWQSLNGLPKHHRKLVANELLSWPDGILSLGDKIPLGESAYTDYADYDNIKNWIRLLPVYKNCNVNIITESLYSQTHGIISEKTLMAILALQVPLIIGHQGAVRDCQHIGIDMFTDVLDTTYDELPHGERLFKALSLNKDKILNLDRSEIINRLLANRDYILNKWPLKLIDDYNADVKLIASRLGCIEKSLDVTV